MLIVVVAILGLLIAQCHNCNNENLIVAEHVTDARLAECIRKKKRVKLATLETALAVLHLDVAVLV